MEMTSGQRAGAGRLRTGALAVAMAAALLPALPAVGAAPVAWREVVVTGAGAARAVLAAGGEVLADLPVAHGVAARLPAAAVLGAGLVVAPQRELRVTAAGATPTGADSTVRATLGLPADGDEGRGVRVAVVDTGVADVPGLAGAVARRVDLTGTGPGDGLGHGTFMAGLIAGSGAPYRGVAPGATIDDVKVADAAGRTDLITVLRGLQWVADRARTVDVVNLSLASGSPLPYQVDPLNQALRTLWTRGVTVVVPSGNDGPAAGSVSSPGNDPLLLTVGGLDERGTADRTDDVVGPWSGRGPTWQGDAKPDLVAPGASLISLRAPGSVADTTSPGSRVGADHFRGTGTSMASAVTAGLVAATLAVAPTLRPDAIKDLVVGTGYAAPGLGRAAGAGAGGLDGARVLAAAPTWHRDADQRRAAHEAAALARDADRWTELEEALLAGDAAAAGRAWTRLTGPSRDWAARAWADLDPAARAWAARAWAARAWAGDEWTARAWAGEGDEWAARAWAARAWAARAWASEDWAARAWASDEWTARAWAARAWAARAWAQSDWAARAWAGDDWAARAWAGDEWAARAWAARAWASDGWAARAWASGDWSDVEWAARAWAAEQWSARAWAWSPG
jgi:serine protease AprX